MRSIRKPIGLMVLLVIVVAAAMAPTLASAKGKKAHKYSSTVQSATLSTANGYPLPGGSAVTAGTVKTNTFGSGALVDRITITGQPSPTVFEFKGKETDFFAAGSMKNTFTGTATVQPDGSQVLEVEGTVTGGTARYKGASGHYSFTGTVAPGSTVINGHSSGKVKY